MEGRRWRGHSAHSRSRSSVGRTNKEQDHNNPQGFNAGDPSSDGKGQTTFLVVANDWDPKAIGGWSLVIHSAADGRTDPSGNSGERIACGVFYLRRD